MHACNIQQPHRQWDRQTPSGNLVYWNRSPPSRLWDVETGHAAAATCCYRTKRTMGAWHQITGGVYSTMFGCVSLLLLSQYNVCASPTFFPRCPVVVGCSTASAGLLRRQPG
ncbi:hypothetical protein F4777DRAFT_293896 [Nemania sp. FL0916]|nr:hypothetical protein F4777DRAFT_293896 [Nemania sp. FL0916]